MTERTTKDAHEMTTNELRSRIVTLAFDGDERLFIAFYRKLQQGLPLDPGNENRLRAERHSLTLKRAAQLSAGGYKLTTTMGDRGKPRNVTGNIT